MRSATLEELCEINVGRTPARAGAQFWGAGEPWLSIADMNQGQVITATKEQITSAGAKGGKQVKPGTVLLSFKLSIGKVAVAGIPLYTNEAIAALPIRDCDVLDGQYLVRALAALDLTGGANRAAMGATLNKAKLREIRVPLPALHEQRRIAAILDHADALRAKRRKVLAHLEVLTQSIFHDMFQAIETSVVLGDVSKIQGGLQVSQKRANLPLEVPYLRVANVHRGRLDLTEVKLIHATAAEAQRTKLAIGDLLFVEGHANPLEVGRAALWAGQVEDCVHQNHLIRARLDQSQVLPAFATVWFNTPLGADHFRRAGRTTSGLNTISSSTVRAAPLPVPQMNQQREFVARIGQASAAVGLVTKGLAADNELFASLQTRAFKGEL